MDNLYKNRFDITRHMINRAKLIGVKTKMLAVSADGSTGVAAMHNSSFGCDNPTSVMIARRVSGIGITYTYIAINNVYAIYNFGISAALNANGSVCAIGCPCEHPGEHFGIRDEDVVFIFECAKVKTRTQDTPMRNTVTITSLGDFGGGVWGQSAELFNPEPVPHARFGRTVQLSDDGKQCSVYATGTDTTTVFKYEGTKWNHVTEDNKMNTEQNNTQQSTTNDTGGDQTAPQSYVIVTTSYSADGKTQAAGIIDISNPHVQFAATHIFVNTGTDFKWTHVTRLVKHGDNFQNYRVAINDNGTVCAVLFEHAVDAGQNPGKNALQIHELIGGEWLMRNEITDQLGHGPISNYSLKLNPVGDECVICEIKATASEQKWSFTLTRKPPVGYPGMAAPKSRRFNINVPEDIRALAKACVESATPKTEVTNGPAITPDPDRPCRIEVEGIPIDIPGRIVDYLREYEDGKDIHDVKFSSDGNVCVVCVRDGKGQLNEGQMTIWTYMFHKLQTGWAFKHLLFCYCGDSSKLLFDLNADGSKLVIGYQNDSGESQFSFFITEGGVIRLHETINFGKLLTIQKVEMHGTDNVCTAVVKDNNGVSSVIKLTLMPDGKWCADASISAKDTVLTDSPCASENGGYTHGVSLNTAYMSHPAVSEDGILIDIPDMIDVPGGVINYIRKKQQTIAAAKFSANENSSNTSEQFVDAVVDVLSKEQLRVEVNNLRTQLKEAKATCERLTALADDAKTLMRFDPVTGEANPYPSNKGAYRYYHGAVAWLFNPYSGNKRDPRDIGSDVFGHLIATNPFEPRKAQSKL